ncbi:MAG: DUF192 domain-containing protein [Candidatus Marsarchaeota archaeon]|nr:DUF192 domain-containing protein [Candidatus Marsarchaeota archaeon]
MLSRVLYEILQAHPYEKKSVTVRGRRLRLDVADTFLKKMVGLMHRESMGKVDGMLFRISEPGIVSAAITMMDMKFSIDIVWLNSEKRVVDIARNARPSRSMFGSYKPRSAASYVLELKAGEAKRLGIKQNDLFRFS